MRSIIITVALVTLAGFGIFMAVNATMADNQRDACADQQVVITGSGHFLCVSPDGRIVGHG